MDLIDAAELLGAIAAEPDPGQILADLHTLLALFSSIKANGLDIPGMVKAGTLAGEIGAIARVSTLAESLLSDNTHGPQLVAFLTSIFPSPTTTT